MQTRLDSAADKSLRKALDGPTRVDKAACLRVAKQNGEGDWFSPWLKTAFGPGKLTSDEFLYYQLYRKELSDSDRARYVGKTVQTRVHLKCNERAWHACADNKLLFHRLMVGSKLPSPVLKAVRGPGSSLDTWSDLATVDALRDYLATSANYPLFVKPVEGRYSIGAMLLRQIDNGSIELGNGSRVSADKLIDYMMALDDSGYLLQAPLVGAPELTAVTGEGLVAARLMVLLEDAGPRLHLATLKLPLVDHDADNFWRTGNMVAPIDLETGIAGPAIAGHAHELSEVETHPDTGAALGSVRLPYWTDTVRTVLEAARLFPGIRTQGWDVAFTSEGPVLLELNFGGDLNLHQLAHQRGILDAAFCQHLRSCGYRRKLPSD